MINEPAPPTKEDIKKFKEDALKELSALKKSDDEEFFDEDCPELTDEQLARLMPVHFREKFFLEKLNG